ncbi:MAG: DMT family transporter, partial [Oligoflexia bacterium]|nr:DMT family transporter [Oligoflexia bacterium]
MNSDDCAKKNIQDSYVLESRNIKFIFIGLLVLSNAIWASSFAITKIVLHSMSPIVLSFWRFFIAGVVMLPLLKRKEMPAKFSSQDLLLLLAMGVISCALAPALQYLA